MSGRSRRRARPRGGPRRRPSRADRRDPRLHRRPRPRVGLARLRASRRAPTAARRSRAGATRATARRRRGPRRRRRRRGRGRRASRRVRGEPDRGERGEHDDGRERGQRQRLRASPAVARLPARCVLVRPARDARVGLWVEQRRLSDMDTHTIFCPPIRNRHIRDIAGKPLRVLLGACRAALSTHNMGAAASGGSASKDSESRAATPTRPGLRSRRNSRGGNMMSLFAKGSSRRAKKGSGELTPLELIDQALPALLGDEAALSRERCQTVCTALGVEVRRATNGHAPAARVVRPSRSSAPLASRAVDARDAGALRRPLGGRQRPARRARVLVARARELGVRDGHGPDETPGERPLAALSDGAAARASARVAQGACAAARPRRSRSSSAARRAR